MRGVWTAGGAVTDTYRHAHLHIIYAFEMHTKNCKVVFVSLRNK